MYNKQTLGTCSICGGPVTVPTVFHSIVPPVPQCEACGAVAAPKTWPVVPMVPAVPTETGVSITWKGPSQVSSQGPDVPA